MTRDELKEIWHAIKEIEHLSTALHYESRGLTQLRASSIFHKAKLIKVRIEAKTGSFEVKKL